MSVCLFLFLFLSLPARRWLRLESLLQKLLRLLLSADYLLDGALAHIALSRGVATRRHRHLALCIKGGDYK